jgi:Arc/MetJ-type ribon-helix-helix transcriptional regulator
MTVTLNPELQHLVEELVRTGRFATPQDVIEAGLGRLRGEDFGDFRPGEMEGLLGSAEAQFARGEGHAIDDVRRHFRDKAANGVRHDTAE